MVTQSCTYRTLSVLLNLAKRRYIFYTRNKLVNQMSVSPVFSVLSGRQRQIGANIVSLHPRIRPRKVGTVFVSRIVIIIFLLLSQFTFCRRNAIYSFFFPIVSNSHTQQFLHFSFGHPSPFHHNNLWPMMTVQFHPKQFNIVCVKE